jgi:2-C-methyl-D-erythritol 4-phosphate cytidylyltransferase
MKKYAVIVAGGNGSRMNTAIPKQFLLLKNKPVLFYTLDVFLKAYSDMHIILVLPTEYLSDGKKIIDDFFKGKQIQITVGGNTRFHSVQNGLQLIKEECIVFVHDGVRCLLTTSLIHRCYETALRSGSAIPVIDSKDSVRIVSGQTSETIDRNNIKLAQTPQTFQSKILLPAFTIECLPAFTDEASVVEASGLKINLVQGEENNIKITSPVDLIIAEKILEANEADNKNSYL